MPSFQHSPGRQPHSFRWVILLVLGSLSCVQPSLRADAVEHRTLFSRAAVPDLDAFGDAVAISATYVVAGHKLCDDDGDNAGAVFVYDTATGRYLRRLRPTSNPLAPSDNFGASVAISGHLAVVGAPMDDDLAGVAFVFDLRTGRELHRLTASDPAFGDTFGESVAISGDLVLVGAAGNDDNGNNTGSAYSFNARTGAFLNKILPFGVSAEYRFGKSVALQGSVALIGSPGDSDAKGSAWVCDAVSGLGLAKLALPEVDRTANDSLGGSVALSGNYAVLGATGDDEIDNNSGAAYVMDIRSGAVICKFKASDAGAGDNLGMSVSISGHVAMAGAPYHSFSEGAAYLFSVHTGAQVEKISPDGLALADEFGTAVAVDGSWCAISAPRHDEQAPNAGAVFTFKSLAVPRPLLLKTVATSGAVAPNTAGTGKYKNLSANAFVNPSNSVVLQSTLSDPAIRESLDVGVFNDISGTLKMTMRRNSGGGLRLTPTRAWSERGFVPGDFAFALIQGVMSGPGKNSSNNAVLLRDDGTSVFPIAQNGPSPFLSLFGEGVVSKFNQFSQTDGLTYDRIAINARLKQGPGGVRANNDSAVYMISHLAAAEATHYREGVTHTGTEDMLGQISTSVVAGHDSNFITFGASLIPPDSTRAVQAVLYCFASNPTALVAARQGADAPDMGLNPDMSPVVAKYRSMLGETADNNGVPLWKASLQGAGITTRNNEGLWYGVIPRLVARKGQVIDLATNTQIAAIRQFWAINSSTQALIHVKLKGPRITAANDHAVCLWSSSDSENLHVLLQEGQVVEGSDAPKVGVIQKIDTDRKTGRYMILCSLTGAAARNQALFVGQTSLGNAGVLRDSRLPTLRLRKGASYLTAPGTPDTRITSLILPKTTNARGAGGLGQGQTINGNGIGVFSAQFSNRKREVLHSQF